MEYKSHPYYDRSNASDWMSLRSHDRAEADNDPEKTLRGQVQSDQQWLCGLALERIRSAVDASYLAERPHAEVNEFLYFPLGEQGYRVYIEYFFFQRPDENSPDNDFWWVIINLPYARTSGSTGEREAYVIGLGWAVA